MDKLNDFYISPEKLCLLPAAYTIRTCLLNTRYIVACGLLNTRYKAWKGWAFIRFETKFPEWLIFTEYLILSDSALSLDTRLSVCESDTHHSKQLSQVI